MRELPVSRTARRRFGLDGAAATAVPRLTGELASARRVAAIVNASLPPGDPPVLPGELAALALLHEVFHLVVERVAALDPGAAMPVVAHAVEGALGADPATVLLDALADEFPTVEPAPGPDRLEELLLLRIANENPAARPMRPLVDDAQLPRRPVDEAMAAIEGHHAARPPIGPAGETLVELLRAPARAHPTSLAGQLRYVEANWGPILGEEFTALLRRLTLVRDVIAEDERGLHLRFGGGGAGGGGAGGGADGGDGGAGGRPDIADLTGLEAEPERFSSDSAWMPRLVLIAKSTHVWLDQLSRRYGRDIRTLDAIPDEELDRLARWGITGLWLIGLWERSRASQRIKAWRGNPDAAASAYALDDYRIAGDLGGDQAWASLRQRAWSRGIRLASDMVPNHMGIDSRWLIEHPEWFLSVPEPPYPAYTFEGQNLADDERIEIRLEDHYWDSSDAAVVFERHDRWSGDRRYVYHGNDGTSFPWNDTAQLDFSQAAVREQVIRVILDVARQFPIIRFDAAMVLARKHVRRLWFPGPGEGGGGIPSRAEFGTMTQAEFDAAMPHEFWREVVDRVATEVPDTLLLAEAFWMLEGYFVRTLGMHRVYNSAFMHMLRDEDNAGYRRVMRETIEFDPEILKRYVNFMNNPDEKTAVEQFGKGDKYVGVATLMATFPGLPMFGHGQFEGFAEKYGMEFRRAQLDEPADEWLVARHEREIVPLLHQRADFAEAADFRLYDVTAGGTVLEDVFAYSNGSGPTRSIVLYHNRYAEADGWIRVSCRFAVKDADGSKRLVTSTLADALGVADGPADDRWVAYRDQRSGLEHLRSVAELRERGLRVHLRAYESRVLWQFRELVDTTGVWRRVAQQLGGAGVPSLEDALRELALAPVHGALRAALDVPTASTVAALVDAVAEATGSVGDRPATVAAILELVAASREAAATIEDASQRAAFDAWAVLARLGALPEGADAGATIRAWYEELRLGPVLASVGRGHGLDEASTWAAVDRVRALLDLPLPGEVRGTGPRRPARLLDAWLARPALREFLGVNTWEGAEYVRREAFEELVAWMSRLDRLATPPEARLRAPVMRSVVARQLLEAGAQGGYRVDQMRELLAGPASHARPGSGSAGSGAATPPRLPKATGLPPGPVPKRRGREDDR